MQIDPSIDPAFISHSATVADRFGSGWRGATLNDVVWFAAATGTLPNRYLVRDADGCWYDADPDDGGRRLVIIGGVR
jgi:hypothetical protein